MILRLAHRMWRTTDARLLWKFGYNFGYKGVRSVQRFKKRLKNGHAFPAFQIRLGNTVRQLPWHRLERSRGPPR